MGPGLTKQLWLGASHNSLRYAAGLYLPEQCICHRGATALWQQWARAMALRGAVSGTAYGTLQTPANHAQ